MPRTVSSSSISSGRPAPCRTGRPGRTSTSSCPAGSNGSTRCALRRRARHLADRRPARVSARDRSGCTRTPTSGRPCGVRGPANHFLFAPTAGALVRLRRGRHRITPIVPMIEAAEPRRRVDPALRRAVAFHHDLRRRARGAYGPRVEVYAADEGRRLDLAARFETPVTRTVVYSVRTRAPSRGTGCRDVGLAPREPSTSSGSRRRCSALPCGRETVRGRPLMMSGLTVTVPPERSCSTSSRSRASSSLRAARGHLRHVRGRVIDGATSCTAIRCSPPRSRMPTAR